MGECLGAEGLFDLFFLLDSPEAGREFGAMGIVILSGLMYATLTLSLERIRFPGD